MTGEEFVKGIERTVRDASNRDTFTLLERPPGRNPRASLVAQSTWYRSLAPRERELLSGIVRLAVDQALFGFFCVIDGTRFIEDGPDRGSFELHYVRGSTTPLYTADTPMLHELYESLSHDS